MKLAKLILNLLEDFKTVETKFIKQGFDKEEVKTTIDLFKKNKQKIKDKEELNIDNWGKGSYEDFKEFVASLEKTTTKTQAKKLEKMDGADLIHEDSDWYVYEISSKEASIRYGSGTKWCISAREGNHFNSYAERVNFYFYISKTLTQEDPNYKIAMVVYIDGNIEYYDAVDSKYPEEPPIKLPAIRYEEFRGKVNLDGLLYSINKLMKMKDIVVEGSVTLSNLDLTDLPDFKSVGGDFFCISNKLTSLKGSPKSVGGGFYCFGNKLTSLQGSPESVGGEFDCAFNKLTSLKGSPKSVGGGFDCSENTKQFTEEEVRAVCDVGGTISV